MCNTADGLETSLALIEKIFWASHFLVMRHGSIYYLGMSTPKTTVWLVFNPHEIIETPLHDQKVGVGHDIMNLDNWSHIL
jgi:hypothetical protein